MRKILEKALAEHRIFVTPEQIQKLLDYLNLIQQWNRVFNLTAITDPVDMVYLHIIDSLLVGPYLHGDRCLDIGSGAGLPGIPLAIMYPQLSFTLLDKNNKKTRFLTQTIAELKLKNVNVVHARSEDFAEGTGFDSILSRAFGKLNEFAQVTQHLLNPFGLLLAMKGKVIENELAALPQQFELVEIVNLVIKGKDTERHLIILKQKRN